MTAGLGIFVNTPSLSRFKVELCAELGRLRAEAFYLSSAEAVASVAEATRQSVDLSSYWVVAEAEATHGDAWVDLPVLAQGEGDLGSRLARVYAALLERHGRALLVGADSPQLCPRLLLQALDWLHQPGPRLAIGRAEDGGFWLFAGNVPLAAQRWAQARYGSADTAEQLMKAMRSAGAWLQLEVLADVDRAADLATVRRQLGALPAPTPAQQQLLQWMDDALLDTCPAGARVRARTPDA